MGGGGGVLQCSGEGREGERGSEGETRERTSHAYSTLCAWGRDEGSRGLSASVGDVWREVWAGTEEPRTLPPEEK